ncbi:cellulose biosynthesis protein BcsN [Shinella kummerowiae]|uniref:cellulose biosynthesis protein BcsN n=1 Tax=Shinella kummerowiae TaxID=417745 RepID=UPI0021B625C6|nr:cellulose biosynthesis protein BcsN [Shinella kummerowiae]MCT7665810.1 cellulose biosynthesis protein BcsN [Shinella kummerowiae]
MRRLLVATIPLLVAGCTAVPDPFLETGAIRPDAPPLSTEVSPEFAAGYLPSIAGRVESVRQTSRADFFEQKIVYTNTTASAGENLLTVRVGTPSEGMAFLRAPTRNAILAEMRQALPGVAMAINTAPGQNPYGVYGYATGPLGKAGSCVYAWQFVKRVSPMRGTAMGRFGAGNYSAQVRLRFCHPTMPQERLAVLMDGMRLKPVTRETFDMLSYAGGSGSLRSQPVLARAEPVVIVDDSVEAEPRRTPKRRVVEEKRKDEPVVIRNAVRVPLPGEAVEEKQKVAVTEKAAEKPEEKAKARATSALVPMPETASLTEAD